MEKSEFEQKYSNLIETITLHLHGFIHIGQESWVLFSCPTISCGDRIWSDILALSEDSVQQAFVRAVFLGTTIPALSHIPEDAVLFCHTVVQLYDVNSFLVKKMNI